jgi:hypothetical protein
MPNNHDIFVKVGLTADQYIFLRDEADSRDLSQSAYLRQLIEQDRRRCAVTALSLPAMNLNMNRSGQE